MVGIVEQEDGSAPTVSADGGASPSGALVPRGRDGAPRPLPTLAEAARACTACGLFEHATQTVFGEGPERAPLMLVGEQPGDLEDRAGRPFVGPAGRLLDQALATAGLDRAHVYVTNAVKHFSFTRPSAAGRRIHQKPKAREVKACAGWLTAEIERVAPRVIVALGATAAQVILGPAFRLTEARGEPQLRPGQPPVVATFHPSALLRAQDEEARKAMWTALTQDLARASVLADAGPARGAPGMQTAARGTSLVRGRGRR